MGNASSDELREALEALLVQAENAAWLTARGRAAFDESGRRYRQGTAWVRVT
ncbi:MAG: hypothetical protein LBH11_05230 [Propionibacteriaceae bacterium]|nr:hypothetical protein [Propionibacteriaceae bacterium]